jgi:hypothetical protein
MHVKLYREYERVSSISDSFSTCICWDLAVHLHSTAYHCLLIFIPKSKYNLLVSNMIFNILSIHFIAYSEGSTQRGQVFVFTFRFWKHAYHFRPKVETFGSCTQGRRG